VARKNVRAWIGIGDTASVSDQGREQKNRDGLTRSWGCCNAGFTFRFTFDTNLESSTCIRFSQDRHAATTQWSPWRKPWGAFNSTTFISIDVSTYKLTKPALAYSLRANCTKVILTLSEV